MLMTTVMIPESFSACHFVDPTYHLNMEVLLRAIDANGLILVDKNETIYEELCDNVERLAMIGHGQRTHILFEELLKKQRQKVIRFVKTRHAFDSDCLSADVASSIAMRCKADTLVSDPENYKTLAESLGSKIQVLSVTDYISSKIETERRRYFESLPSLDQMVPGQFDRSMIDATRFSRWIRFYDKQIGKGTGSKRFRKGLAKILRLWTESAHFPKEELSVEIYTIVDESFRSDLEPATAYRRVEGELVEPLRREFGIAIKLFFKWDSKANSDSSAKRISHPRHLETQSLAILFEKGFDFVEDDGTLCRTFVKLDPASGAHLREYRQLRDYVPESVPSKVSVR
jgi:hypothetical protein